MPASRDRRLIDQSYNALLRVSDWLRDLDTVTIDGEALDSLGAVIQAVYEAENEQGRERTGAVLVYLACAGAALLGLALPEVRRLDRWTSDRRGIAALARLVDDAALVRVHARAEAMGWPLRELEAELARRGLGR